jgi:2-keto-4-pentenoate hydratase/2-oxohepta-3-ene-1,7-dioic acid hydratase in catechol pathway
MLERSNKVVAVAFNYKDLKKHEKSRYKFPALFLKSPTSIIYNGDEILIPPAAQGRTWGEVELAIEIGVPAYNPTTFDEKVLGTIRGFGVANDVSAFNVNDMDVHLAFSKALDTFCPISKEFKELPVKDVSNLRMTMSINGEVMQDSNTSKMFFNPIKVLEFISSYMTLYPGDIVLTGTPKHDKRILLDGDEITVEVEGLDKVTNKVKYVDFSKKRGVVHY